MTPDPEPFAATAGMDAITCHAERMGLVALYIYCAEFTGSRVLVVFAKVSL